MKRLLSFLKGEDQGPSASQIQKAVKQVTEPHGDAAVRMNAAIRLKGWGTREAIAGLLRRFTIQTSSGAVDLEECQEVEQMLVDLGSAAVEPILAFLGREEAVAYPARALEKILPREEFVARVLAVLEKLEAGFASVGNQRAGLIRALEQIDDPRIAPGIARFVRDPDDDVANAAIAGLGRARDLAYREPLIEVLLATADRPRVRREVAEALAGLEWSLEERRKEVAAALPPEFRLDRNGKVVAGP